MVETVEEIEVTDIDACIAWNDIVGRRSDGDGKWGIWKVGEVGRSTGVFSRGTDRVGSSGTGRVCEWRTWSTVEARNVLSGCLKEITGWVER